MKSDSTKFLEIKGIKYSLCVSVCVRACVRACVYVERGWGKQMLLIKQCEVVVELYVPQPLSVRAG